MTSDSTGAKRATVMLLLSLMAGAGARAGTLDVVRFGDAASEGAHGLAATRSRVVAGGMGCPARVLDPTEPAGDYGGSVAFTVKVDPERPTYLTMKYWGSDHGVDRGRLLLFVDGKHVGYRHIGDVDCLDIISDEPRFPGRFYYTTTVLPRAMTAGKSELRVEVRSLGRIWGYGETWERFQKPLTESTRGVYAAFTHTEGFFSPPAGEVQGAAPAAGVRAAPGAEVLASAKERVNGELSKLLAASGPVNQMQAAFLARAYHVKWTVAYRRAEVVERVRAAVDELYRRHKADPKLVGNETATPNPDWFGYGLAAQAMLNLRAELAPSFDEVVGGGTRRSQWTELFLASREYHRVSRRQYTNQSMIKDNFGTYLPNRAVAVLSPERALPEAEARRYLYESVGLQPWLGSDTADGRGARPLGDHYMQITDKGLTRELGYVGGYGEVIDWVCAIYESTRGDYADAASEGDAKVRAQLVRIAKARGAFRYPAVDEAGGRAMLLETVVGWRDNHYPGDVTYGQRPTRDAGPLAAAVMTNDPDLLGYARQMLDDNQFFASLAGVMNEKSLRVTIGLLDTPGQFEAVSGASRGGSGGAATGAKLPMAGGADFVYSDEEDGVVALRNGDEVLYASLYWRARYGINRLGRVHHLTPTEERDATVWVDVKYTPSGMTYRRDGRLVEPQTTRHEKSKGAVTQALEGEEMPIAKIPEGVTYKQGQESIYAGKAEYYELRYGPYVIAMNTTADKTFEFVAPAAGRELVGRREVAAGAKLAVGPRSTVVVYSPGGG